uniref:Ubiquitin-like protease family profile domain-containing protein n=1 Tax=Ditylenchus dipsaci TaxID=166011 RepID=A0A915E539_9BILA
MPKVKFLQSIALNLGRIPVFKASEKSPKAVLNWVKNEEIFAFELLLIPIFVRVTGHEWYTFSAKNVRDVIIQVVNNNKERLVYYDSLLGDGTVYSNLIKHFLQEYAIEYGYEALEPGNCIAFCPKDITRQTNTFDCGAFT